MTQTPVILDELNQLLAESARKPKPPKPKFDDLDDLLAESLSIQSEAGAYAANRERLKRANLKSEEREAIESKVREWESRNVWTTTAIVAVFERVTCSCGYYTDAFSHMMHRQTHKHQRASIRLIRDDNVPAGLPKMVGRQHAEVEICAECASEKGWDMDNLEEIEWQAPTLK